MTIDEVLLIAWVVVAVAAIFLGVVRELWPIRTSLRAALEGPFFVLTFASLGFAAYQILLAR